MTATVASPEKITTSGAGGAINSRIVGNGSMTAADGSLDIDATFVSYCRLYSFDFAKVARAMTKVIANTYKHSLTHMLDKNVFTADICRAHWAQRQQQQGAFAMSLHKAKANNNSNNSGSSSTVSSPSAGMLASSPSSSHSQPRVHSAPSSPRMGALRFLVAGQGDEKSDSEDSDAELDDEAEQVDKFKHVLDFSDADGNICLDSTMLALITQQKSGKKSGKNSRPLGGLYSELDDHETSILEDGFNVLEDESVVNVLSKTIRERIKSMNMPDVSAFTPGKSGNRDTEIVASADSRASASGPSSSSSSSEGHVSSSSVVLSTVSSVDGAREEIKEGEEEEELFIFGFSDHRSNKLSISKEHQEMGELLSRIMAHEDAVDPAILRSRDVQDLDAEMVMTRSILQKQDHEGEGEGCVQKEVSDVDSDEEIERQRRRVRGDLPSFASKSDVPSPSPSPSTSKSSPAAVALSKADPRLADPRFAAMEARKQARIQAALAQKQQQR